MEIAVKATIAAVAVLLAVVSRTVPVEAHQEPVRRVAPEVELTGCIVQGSSSAVFIFDNAKTDPTSALEKGERYLLTSLIDDLNLRSHLNHQVRITGEVDLRVSAMPERRPAPSDPKGAVNEHTLPRLIVKSVTMVSDKCR
jgi:hypothetical protein